MSQNYSHFIPGAKGVNNRILVLNGLVIPGPYQCICLNTWHLLFIEIRKKKIEIQVTGKFHDSAFQVIQ